MKTMKDYINNNIYVKYVHDDDEDEMFSVKKGTIGKIVEIDETNQMMEVEWPLNAINTRMTDGLFWTSFDRVIPA